MADENAIALVDEPQQLAPVRRSILTISQQQVERIKLLAGMMAESQLEYGKMKPGDIFIKMMKGLEVGLEPVASMDLIDVIQGKPTLKPQGMLALAWGSGLMQSLSITDDDKTCTVKMQRTGSPVHIEMFSADDAKSMGLSGKDNWKKQPAVMRKWRAVSAACRIVFPDIIQGMYIADEIAPDTIVDDDGAVVEADYQDIEKSNGSQPTETTWPSRDTVQFVMDWFKRQMELSSKEVFDLAGVQSFDDGDGWRKYDSAKAAIKQIQSAFDAQLEQSNMPDNTEHTATFHYMNYIGKHSNLQFAINNPVTEHDKPNTYAILYGGRGAIKSWGGTELYEQLQLSQYDKIKDKDIVSDFVKMVVPVEFRFVSDGRDDSSFKIVGIVGDPVIPY